MKKMISIFLLSSMVALTPVTRAAPVSPLVIEPDAANFEDFFAFVEPGEFAEFSKPCPRGTVRVRKRTRTKTKVVNSAIFGGVATAIGAGVGGKRGALIGAGSGVGGYLLYRYVKDRRGRCVLRRA